MSRHPSSPLKGNDAGNSPFRWHKKGGADHSTASPTDKERIAHAKKLYYAAQANMTPEREEELRSYFHKLALPYNQHLGAVWSG